MCKCPRLIYSTAGYMTLFSVRKLCPLVVFWDTTCFRTQWQIFIAELTKSKLPSFLSYSGIRKTTSWSDAVYLYIQ